MANKKLENLIINNVIENFSIYWPKNKKLITNFLRKNYKETKLKNIKLKSKKIKLNRYKNLGINNKIIIPNSFASSANIENLDWANIIFFLVNNLFEKEYEEKNDKIFSYSNKLKNIDKTFFSYAWANRYALLLREIVANKEKKTAAKLFGEKPPGKIILTHDIDIIKKTLNNIIKQSIFNLFNIFKSLIYFKLNDSFKFLKKIFYLINSNDTTNNIKYTLEKNKKLGLTPIYFIYSNTSPSNFFHNFLNPTYSIKNNATKKKIKEISLRHKIGLHQSFQASENSKLMKVEKSLLDKIFNIKAKCCRQHWFNFSFKNTWKAQYKSGFMFDFTLGFNDSMGFRNSSCISFKPLDYKLKRIGLYSIPMILMDSHLYDYELNDEKNIRLKIKKIIDEVKFVGGVASINWHPHTLGKEYGWREGYKYLIKYIKNS